MAHKPKFKVSLKIVEIGKSVSIEYGYYILDKPLLCDNIIFNIGEVDQEAMYSDLVNFTNALWFSANLLASKEIIAAKTYEAKMELIKQFMEDRDKEIVGHG